MELNFINKNGVYEAEFQASGPAVFQLEREAPGYIKVERRLLESMPWSEHKTWGRQTARESFTADLTSSAYPVFFKITTESAVVACAVVIGSASAGGSGITDEQVQLLQAQIDRINGVGDTTEEIDTLPEALAAMKGMKNTDTVKEVAQEETKQTVNSATMSESDLNDVLNLIP